MKRGCDVTAVNGASEINTKPVFIHVIGSLGLTVLAYVILYCIP
jgi:hypothetical protein